MLNLNRCSPLLFLKALMLMLSPTVRERDWMCVAMQVCLDICFEPSTTSCGHRYAIQSLHKYVVMAFSTSSSNFDTGLKETRMSYWKINCAWLESRTDKILLRYFSFCRGCLQSVYQKCGMRCPKCRQELRWASTVNLSIYL